MDGSAVSVEQLFTVNVRYSKALRRWSTEINSSIDTSSSSVPKAKAKAKTSFQCSALSALSLSVCLFQSVTVFVVDAAALGAIDIVHRVEDQVAQFQNSGHHSENVGDLLRRETYRLQRFLNTKAKAKPNQSISDSAARSNANFVKKSKKQNGHLGAVEVLLITGPSSNLTRLDRA